MLDLLVGAWVEVAGLVFWEKVADGLESSLHVLETGWVADFTSVSGV